MIEASRAKGSRAEDKLEGFPWLSQITAALAIVATAVGRVVAPGLRGSASQHVVDTWDGIAHFTAFAFLVFLIFLFVRAAWDIVFSNKPSVFLRVLVVSGAFSVLCIVVMTIFKRSSIPTPAPALVVLALLASFVALLTGAGTLRPPHTRLAAFVLLAFGAAASVRCGAWALAVTAGQRAAPMTYEISRGIATLGVVLEGIGQILAVVWLITRTRVSGQILAAVSVFIALAATYGVAEGAHAGAPTWQAVLHTALADVRGTPPPLELSVVVTFAFATSILFATVAVLRPGPTPAISSALALCLVARGTFDVPLLALSTCVGAAWLLVASVDERTMWKALAARGGDNKGGVPLGKSVEERPESPKPVPGGSSSAGAKAASSSAAAAVARVEAESASSSVESPNAASAKLAETASASSANVASAKLAETASTSSASAASAKLVDIASAPSPSTSESGEPAASAGPGETALSTASPQAIETVGGTATVERGPLESEPAPGPHALAPTELANEELAPADTAPERASESESS